MRLARVFLAITCMDACAYAAYASELPYGLPRVEVERQLGPPYAVHLERNGVICLTYPSEPAPIRRARIRVVALKESRLIQDDVVAPDRIRFHCSKAAGRWDPPPRYGR